MRTHPPAVWDQSGVPLTAIMQAAGKWIGNQITRWQPGAYKISEDQGGLYETVYGVHRSAPMLETDGTTDTATITTIVAVGLPDGTRRPYTVTITVSGRDVDRNEGTGT